MKIPCDRCGTMDYALYVIRVRRWRWIPFISTSLAICDACYRALYPND